MYAHQAKLAPHTANLVIAQARIVHAFIQSYTLSIPGLVSLLFSQVIYIKFSFPMTHNKHINWSYYDIIMI